jgi:hypothetical protein
MNTSRDRRLTRLELAQAAQAPRRRDKIIYAWRNGPGESVAQAIARRCPEGVPAGARLVICSWEAEGEPITAASN